MFPKAGFVILVLAFSLFMSGCAAPSPSPSAGLPTGAAPTSTAAPAKSSAPQNTTVPAVTSGASSTAAAGDLVRVVVVPEKSQVNYRVREQLANLQFPSDAVGTTSAITGTLVGKADGTIVSEESKFVVNLGTLKSDAGQRDDFIKRGVLQTNQYPNATFIPKEAPGIPTTVPPSGEAAFKLIGDLTVRNVTKPVTWDTTCKGNGSEGTCTAKTSFQFGYFNLQIPQVARVLSIVDNITLELSIYLTRVN
jgi:polyisoprenoid-binding protein YceI